MPRGRIAAVVVVFIALQATNSATVSVMSLFLSDRLGLAVVWAGVALGIAAGLEIPALLIGKLTGRVSGQVLLLSGCMTGIVYHAAMAFVRGPVLLLGLQLLNAWFFAAVAGVGLTLFQQILRRPRLAAGVYANTRRLGAIAAGPLIGLGSATRLGSGAVFAAAVITVAALAGLRLTPLERPTLSAEGDRHGDPEQTADQRAGMGPSNRGPSWKRHLPVSGLPIVQRTLLATPGMRVLRLPPEGLRVPGPQVAHSGAGSSAGAPDRSHVTAASWSAKTGNTVSRRMVCRTVRTKRDGAAKHNQPPVSWRSC